MSAAMGPYAERTPQSFAEVPPTGDLSGHRGSIAYALGEINATIRHMSEGLQNHATDLKQLRETTEAGLKEVKVSVKAIEDKVLVAETRVQSAFFTSKWFLISVSAIGGFAIAHWSWIVALLSKVN